MTNQHGMAAPVSHIQRRRITDVEVMLRPLRRPKKFKVCEYLEDRNIGYIFSSLDEKDYTRRYSERRLKTDLIPEIWFQYFEIWKPIDKGTHVILSQCCLHLFLTDVATKTLKPLVFLHCDPTFGSDFSDEERKNEQKMRQCRHKQGPHIHIELAPYPIPRCHFPLNLGHLDGVLASVADLTMAMSAAAEILHYEVLHEYKKRRKELGLDAI
jgi:hypothetical protein